MKNIKWKYLIGLNQLYENKKTSLKILNDDYINQILFKQNKLIRYKLGSNRIIESTNRFNFFYEQNFKELIDFYNDFFEKSGIDNNAYKNYDRFDLNTLIFIYENRETLRKTLTTEHAFSNRFFKNKGSKYLSNKTGLRKDVLKLLGVDDFPEQDPKNN